MKISETTTKKNYFSFRVFSFVPTFVVSVHVDDIVYYFVYAVLSPSKPGGKMQTAWKN